MENSKPARRSAYTREQMALELLNLMPDTAEECAQLYGVLDRLTTFMKDVINAKEHTFTNEEYRQSGLHALKRRRRQMAVRLENALAVNNWEIPTAEEVQAAGADEPAAELAIETTKGEPVAAVAPEIAQVAQVPTVNVASEPTPTPAVEPAVSEVEIFTPQVAATPMMPEPVAEASEEEANELAAILAGEPLPPLDDALAIVNDNNEPLVAPAPAPAPATPEPAAPGETQKPPTPFVSFNRSPYGVQ